MAAGGYCGQDGRDVHNARPGQDWSPANRGRDSYEEWDAVAARFYAPNAVWDLGGMLGSIDGSAAIRAFVKEYWLMWDDHHHYAEEIVDLGHAVGYAVVREDARMRGSGGRVQQETPGSASGLRAESCAQGYLAISVKVASPPNGSPRNRGYAVSPEPTTIDPHRAYRRSLGCY